MDIVSKGAFSREVERRTPTMSVSRLLCMVCPIIENSFLLARL